MGVCECVCVYYILKTTCDSLKNVKNYSCRKRIFCQKEQKNLEKSLFTSARGKIHSRKWMFGDFGCYRDVP